MHQAYQVHSILKQGVLIESIAAYGNNVILGTRSGQLIMYRVHGTGTIDMVMFNKSFSKKAITQMEVITNEHLLFVLTDNQMNVCDISRMESNFEFIHSSAQTKGCSLFTLNVKTPISTTGESATVIGLCCAIKRRLQFFFWKVNLIQFTDFSIELKDVPKALCWVDDLICVGFKDEYVMYNILAKDLEKYELIVTSSSYNVDPCICLINNILGVSKDEYLVLIDPIEYIKQKNGKSEMKGSLDTTASSSKSKTTLKPMSWSQPLLDLVWDEPYAIGRTANGIEIRSLVGNEINKETLVQNIPDLSKTKFLVRSENGTIFAAAISELWCIRLEDIPTQRQILLKQFKFTLAIELTNVSEEPNEIKAETIRQIHMQYAKELFLRKQFAAAMTEFAEGSADPYDVIRLFPNLLQDQSLKSSSGDTVTPTAVLPQLEDKDLENALMALIEFLALARQKEIVKIRDAKSTSKSLLSIIDTTLLKCYLQTNDSLVAPLLRLNQCHFEESEKTLKKHDKISELIILYQTNGKHRKALELLQAQASIEGSSLYGHDRTIRYLQQLGSTHKLLIFEFSDWVLKKHPEDGLRIFTEDFIEVENLPRAKVLDFLLSSHKILVIPYLEHVINIWNERNTIINNALVTQYRFKVQALMDDIEMYGENTEEKREKEQLMQEYRSKLYKFLKESVYYSPDVVIQDFPLNIMLEERALILGRLKKHDKVLAIYIQIIGDVNKAAEYCEEHYNEDNEIFVKLLKTILNPHKHPPYSGMELHPDFIVPNHDIVLELLNKYAEKINHINIWPYLPNDMPLHQLRNYMNTVLRIQMAQNHELEIMKGLISAEIVRTNKLIDQQKHKFVEITENSVCPECKKRFTYQSAFVRSPNGEVVHLSCHDKRIHTTIS